jgi:hypothetical protein
MAMRAEGARFMSDPMRKSMIRIVEADKESLKSCMAMQMIYCRLIQTYSQHFGIMIWLMQL